VVSVVNSLFVSYQKTVCSFVYDRHHALSLGRIFIMGAIKYIFFPNSQQCPFSYVAPIYHLFFPLFYSSEEEIYFISTHFKVHLYYVAEIELLLTCRC